MRLDDLHLPCWHVHSHWTVVAECPKMHDTYVCTMGGIWHKWLDLLITWPSLVAKGSTAFVSLMK